jgi:predicted esterase YcpF (UPF0227 family)
VQNLVYIHGFLSSPQSIKAQQVQQWAASQPSLYLHLPALPTGPEAALAMLESIVQSCTSAPGLIGSSLGGFYANILAARHALKAVLINPAVHPHRLLAQHLGENQSYHTGAAVDFQAEHVAVLQQREVTPRNPEKIWVLLETGDETLDYRQAVNFYADCRVDITEGGSHRYDGFLQKIPAIKQFLFN